MEELLRSLVADLVDDLLGQEQQRHLCYRPDGTKHAYEERGRSEILQELRDVAHGEIARYVYEQVYEEKRDEVVVLYEPSGF